MDYRVKEMGRVEYIWVPRRDNEDAGRYCNEAMDQMERNDRYDQDDGY